MTPPATAALYEVTLEQKYVKRSSTEEDQSLKLNVELYEVTLEEKYVKRTSTEEHSKTKHGVVGLFIYHR